ncbi:iron complex outermembrane receptor protein [Mucilaginibacter gracilis]|uniref:Iron complex outermembrane receptor protein n=1 Tax=Mucilaginibacter gracilis TaxID=423350 RepID=A0A495IX22_9SPHI|nr:TonB-dependent receptor [Mucilaginibacter gracilis]RKR80584.1 iron complex outermembrane receptor protein [Mucilaginibacter gracilis]
MFSNFYKNVFLLLLVMTSFNLAIAKNITNTEDPATGTVKGKVLSSDKQPLTGVTVGLKDTKYLTVTDNNGNFRLKAPAGNYILQLTFIGLSPLEQAVAISAGKTTAVPDILLSDSYAQLQEVVISTAKKNKSVSKESDYIARMPLKNLENPQVYTVIPKELLKEQAVVGYSQALANATGAVSGAKAGNGQNYLILRGFADPGFIRNGLTSPQYTDVDPANLERIEVLKGPSGTLFGSAQISYGGLVNRVTKKPLDGTFANVSYTSGSYSLSRFTADINTPVNKDSSALFRINLASHHEGSFQDYGITQNYFVAPVFTYRINKRLDLLVEGEYYTRKATSTPILTIPATSGIKSLDQLSSSIYKKSFLTNEIAFKGTVTNFNMQLNYKMSDNWTSSTNLASSHTDYDYPFLAATIASDTLLTRAAGKTYYDLNFLELQQNFNGKFFLAGMQHRILVGLDYLQRRHTFYSSRAAYDKFNYRKSSGPYVGIDQFDAAIAKLTYNPSKPNSNIYAAYVSDVIDLTSRLNVMGSLRYDDYVDNGGANYKQGSLSPKLGIVYQLVKSHVSLFGNYMNGFNNVSGFDQNGNAFKPQHANQWEGGVKAEYLDGRLTSTVSYYDIKVENILRKDPGNSAFSIQDGTQRSKGLEAEFIGNPVQGLNIIAGYGLNDSRYVQSNPDIQGHRPALVPNNTLNYWVSYTLYQGAAKGLGIGAGGNYYGQNFFDDANIVNIASVNVLGASVFYNQPKFRISLKADNLTNEKYWVSSTPQMPARVLGSLELKF